MRRELFGRNGVVATVFVPDEPFPDVINYKGTLFYYDERRGEFYEAEVLTIGET